MNDSIGGVIGCGFLVLGGIGWLVHVFTCLSHGLWGFLIAGALVFPIGIIHGWGVLLGFW